MNLCCAFWSRRGCSLHRYAQITTFFVLFISTYFPLNHGAENASISTTTVSTPSTASSLSTDTLMEVPADKDFLPVNDDSAEEIDTLVTTAEPEESDTSVTTVQTTAVTDVVTTEFTTTGPTTEYSTTTNNATTESVTAESTENISISTTPTPIKITDSTEPTSPNVTSMSTVATTGAVTQTTENTSEKPPTTTEKPPVTSESPPETTVSAEGGGGLGGGEVAAIVISVLLVVGFLSIAGFFLYKRRQEHERYETLQDFGVTQGLQNPTYDIDL